MGLETAPIFCCSEIIINFTKDRWEAETRRDFPQVPSTVRNAAPGLRPAVPSTFTTGLFSPTSFALIWGCTPGHPVFHISVLLRVIKRRQHNPKS